MLLGMYTIIALAFVSLFLFFNPRPQIYQSHHILTPSTIKVCISRRGSTKGVQFRCFPSGLGLAVAHECSSDQRFWCALYIYMLEIIILYLNRLSIPLQRTPLRHTIPDNQNSLQQHHPPIEILKSIINSSFAHHPHSLYPNKLLTNRIPRKRTSHSPQMPNDHLP